MDEGPRVTSTARSRAKRATAIHEAGHAVAAFHYHLGLRTATIVPSEVTHGQVRHGSPFRGKTVEWSDMRSPNRLHMERAVLVNLAGDIAQRRAYPRSVRRWHADRDHHATVDMVSYFITGSEAQADAYLAYLHVVASDFLALPHVWRAVETVADALMEARTLRGARLRALVRDALRVRVDDARTETIWAPVLHSAAMPSAVFDWKTLNDLGAAAIVAGLQAPAVREVDATLITTAFADALRSRGIDPQKPMRVRRAPAPPHGDRYLFEQDP